MTILFQFQYLPIQSPNSILCQCIKKIKNPSKLSAVLFYWYEHLYTYSTYRTCTFEKKSHEMLFIGQDRCKIQYFFVSITEQQTCRRLKWTAAQHVHDGPPNAASSFNYYYNNGMLKKLILQTFCCSPFLCSTLKTEDVQFALVI